VIPRGSRAAARLRPLPTIAAAVGDPGRTMGGCDGTCRRVVGLVVVLALAACAPASTTASPSATAPHAPTQTLPLSPAAAVPPSSTSAAPTGPVTLAGLIAPGARIEFVAAGLTFAEGPLWLPDGRLIVSDVPGDVVTVIDTAGRMSDFRRPSHHANGHALDTDGSVVQAEHGDTTTPGRITRLARTGPDTVLATSFEGKHLNSPNGAVGTAGRCS